MIVEDDDPKIIHVTHTAEGQDAKETVRRIKWLRRKSLLLFLFVAVSAAAIFSFPYYEKTLLKPRAGTPGEPSERCTMIVEAEEEPTSIPQPTLTPTSLPTTSPPTATIVSTVAPTEGSQFTCSVNKAGNIVSSSGSGTVRLWLQKSDGTVVSNPVGTEKEISGHYYYELSSSADISSLPAGDYWANCDAGDGTNGCSGNPACSWERNLRPEDCALFPGYNRSCSENDNLSFTTP